MYCGQFVLADDARETLSQDRSFVFDEPSLANGSLLSCRRVLFPEPMPFRVAQATKHHEVVEIVLAVVEDVVNVVGFVCPFATLALDAVSLELLFTDCTPFLRP